MVPKITKVIDGAKCLSALKNGSLTHRTFENKTATLADWQMSTDCNVLRNALGQK